MIFSEFENILYKRDGIKVGLTKFDTTRIQHDFYGFGLSIIVFGLYLC